MKQKKDNVTVRIYYDGTADAKDIIADAIAARTDRAMNKKTIEKPADIGYSKDIAPFKNILNEMYSKDISKKVHSSYLLHAKQGKFTGCVAPIGYRKDPDVKGHLLIDEERRINGVSVLFPKGS